MKATVKTLDDITNLAVRNKIAKFTQEVQLKFFDDYFDEVSDALRKAIDGKPELVDSWKKMDNLGADDALRKNPGALDALSKPEGSRPNPSTYLDADYITTHLAEFENGASYLVPKDLLDRFGRDVLGWPDNTQFVMPKSQMDNLLSKTGNDVRKITTELGIDASEWAGRDLVRIDILDPKSLNVRMPSGNELGANNKWIPGGKTSGGRPEAVIDNIPEGKYIESDL